MWTVWLAFGQQLLLTWGSTLPANTGAMPPPWSPVICDATGCTISNAYGVWNDRKECQARSVTYPRTEEELLLAVAQANQKKLKVKIVTGFSHSIPKLACPETGQSSEYQNSTILISTAKYNSGIEVDVKNMIVTTDSGVGLRDLIHKVEEAGLSLVASPYWEGLSIGGLISTGAHGSSWWRKGGTVHNHVVGLSIVVPASESEGYAKIIRLDTQNPPLNAAKVSLGMLGAISKVKLSLEAGFKRSITNIFNDDTRLEDEFMDLARQHEFADITWYPSMNTTVYRKDDRVPLSSSGDGINDFIGFGPTAVHISTSLRASGISFISPCRINFQLTYSYTYLTPTCGANPHGDDLKDNFIFVRMSS
ncbi:FAD linked oxidase [Macleaya cordata]|uniref:FAD linked oxidase n=1 Tax=Macleaya cordata TaxID=56857 RepID=A0A200RC58_MACCD|nr:FAD linked oxidase [Macleaya cordata]